MDSQEQIDKLEQRITNLENRLRDVHYCLGKVHADIDAKGKVSEKIKKGLERIIEDNL